MPALSSSRCLCLLAGFLTIAAGIADPATADGSGTRKPTAVADKAPWWWPDKLSIDYPEDPTAENHGTEMHFALSSVAYDTSKLWSHVSSADRKNMKTLTDLFNWAQKNLVSRDGGPVQTLSLPPQTFAPNAQIHGKTASTDKALLLVPDKVTITLPDRITAAGQDRCSFVWDGHHLLKVVPEPEKAKIRGTRDILRLMFKQVPVALPADW